MTLAAALVGTGDWARAGLAPALADLPGVELVAVASGSAGEAADFARRTGVPRSYGSLEELLDAETGLGLVVIATPDDHHPVASRQALAAGIAVYCEKPLANSGAEAAELAELAERTGVPATVGYSFRYSAALQRMRADLLGGELGTPWLIELAEHNPQFHPRFGKPMNWKGDPAHAAAGALFEYGSHAVDLGCWLLGDVGAVSTAFARVLPGARLDDIATLQLGYACGALGTLVASWVLTGSFPGIRVRLHGSEGLAEARLDETQPGGERYTRFTLTGEVAEEAELAAIDAGHATYARRHLADLVATIAADRPRYPGTLPSLRSGAHVQQVLDSALLATSRRTSVAGAGQVPATAPGGHP